MKRNSFLFLAPTLFFIVLAQLAIARPNIMRIRPFAIGPQYPLTHMRTVFEPDSAFVLEGGDFILDLGTATANNYEFSENSEKNKSKYGDASKFTDEQTKGYSVYLDMEEERRGGRLAIGFFDLFELQYREYSRRFYGGSKLDKQVERFHTNIGLNAPERGQTERNKFEIYVWDNEKKEYVYYIDEEIERQRYNKTWSVKFPMIETQHQAIAFKVSTSLENNVLEKANKANEKNGSDKENDVHKDYSDINYSLYYTASFEPITLNLAASVTTMSEPIFEESPKELYFYFLGINGHFDDSWNLIMQYLRYTSIFPDKDEKHTNLSDDIDEYTMGIRYMFSENWAIEAGFVENVTQGPNNIDIAFFWNLTVSY